MSEVVKAETAEEFQLMAAKTVAQLHDLGLESYREIVEADIDFYGKVANVFVENLAPEDALEEIRLAMIDHLENRSELLSKHRQEKDGPADQLIKICRLWQQAIAKEGGQT